MQQRFDAASKSVFAERQRDEAACGWKDATRVRFIAGVDANVATRLYCDRMRQVERAERQRLYGHRRWVIVTCVCVVAECGYAFAARAFVFAACLSFDARGLGRPASFRALNITAG